MDGQDFDWIVEIDLMLRALERSSGASVAVGDSRGSMRQERPRERHSQHRPLVRSRRTIQKEKSSHAVRKHVRGEDAQGNWRILQVGEWRRSFDDLSINLHNLYHKTP